MFSMSKFKEVGKELFKINRRAITATDYCDCKHSRDKNAK